MAGKNVPIYRAAQIMGKCPQAIRIGLQRGLFPFGAAIPSEEDPKKYNYYISPKLFCDYTGADITDLAVGENTHTE